MQRLRYFTRQEAEDQPGRKANGFDLHWATAGIIRQSRCEGEPMSEQEARPAPEIHVTDIVLPHQTNNENEYNSTSHPANPDFVK